METVTKKTLTAVVMSGALAAGLLSANPASAQPLPSSDLVAHWYRDFLERTLFNARNDPGHQHWAGELDSGTPPSEVLGQITRTGEFAATSVRRIYSTDLDRLPDAGARYWTTGITRGMAVEWVEQNVLASPEYVGTRDGATWVAAVYREVLGRAPSAGEISYRVGRLAQLDGDRLALVREVWYTPEGVDHRTAGHYTGLLGRTPEPGEVAYWRTAEAASDLATSVAFATSAEYVAAKPESEGTTLQAEADEVHSYLAGIAAARWRAAYDRLSPQSQAAIGGYDGFYASRSGLTEGVGAFAVVPERDFQPTAFSEGLTAVVIPGTVVREGSAAYAVASFGVSGRPDGGWMIDTFASPLDLGITPADHVLARGAALGATVAAPGSNPVLAVDGRSACSPSSASARSVSVVPDPPLVPGRHVATVMAQASSGFLQVESVVITAR